MYKWENEKLGIIITSDLKNEFFLENKSTPKEKWEIKTKDEISFDAELDYIFETYIKLYQMFKTETLKWIVDIYWEIKKIKNQVLTIYINDPNQDIEKE